MVFRSPSPVAGARQRRRGPGVWLRLLLVLIVVLLLVNVGLTPWAVHIGGRTTLLEEWDGYGPLRASNGGRYVLFIHFRAGVYSGASRLDCSFAGGCNTLHGSAKLCTEAGQTYSFALAGDVHAWWSTDGAPSEVDLTGGSPTRLPEGWVVALHGRWHGPALMLASPDNSFTEVFTPRGAIRHVTSTADAGTAHATLRYGPAAAFTSACHALATG